MRRNVEDKIFFEGAHFFGPKLSTEEFTILVKCLDSEETITKNIYREHTFLVKNEVARLLYW